MCVLPDSDVFCVICRAPVCRPSWDGVRITSETNTALGQKASKDTHREAQKARAPRIPSCSSSQATRARWIA
eukprot:5298342-Pyramimonas_sp.AAC.1